MSATYDFPEEKYIEAMTYARDHLRRALDIVRDQDPASNDLLDAIEEAAGEVASKISDAHTTLDALRSRKSN